MSDSNKRDDNLQDYLDLLEVMAKKDAEERAKNPCPPPVIKKIEVVRRTEYLWVFFYKLRLRFYWYPKKL